MKIEYGSTEYYTLLNLKYQIENRGYNKLDLVALDSLRSEIDLKIKAIYEEFNRMRQENKHDS